VQVEFPGFVTAVTPPNVGASVHTPVASAVTSFEAGEVQVAPSVDFTT